MFTLFAPFRICSNPFTWFKPFNISSRPTENALIVLSVSLWPCSGLLCVSDQGRVRAALSVPLVTRVLEQHPRGSSELLCNLMHPWVDSFGARVRFIQPALNRRHKHPWDSFVRVNTRSQVGHLLAWASVQVTAQEVAVKCVCVCVCVWEWVCWCFWVWQTEKQPGIFSLQKPTLPRPLKHTHTNTHTRTHKHTLIHRHPIQIPSPRLVSSTDAFTQVAMLVFSQTWVWVSSCLIVITTTSCVGLLSGPRSRRRLSAVPLTEEGGGGGRLLSWRRP